MSGQPHLAEYGSSNGKGNWAKKRNSLFPVTVRKEIA